MKIIIEGNEKEIAALVLAVQEQRGCKDIADQIMNRIQGQAELCRNEPVFLP